MPPLSLSLLSPLIPWRLMGDDEPTQMSLQQGGETHFQSFVLSQHIGSTCCLVLQQGLTLADGGGTFSTGGHRWSPDFRKRIILEFSERLCHFKTNP